MQDRSKSMRVTIVSFMDFCGSGHKLYEALRPHHDVEIFVGAHHNPFGHPTKNVVDARHCKQVQKRLDASRVIIIKGDFPHAVYEREWLVRFNRPTVIMVTGSFFRKKIHGGFERFPLAMYKGLRVSSDTGLLYPEYSDTWTPMPIDCEKEPITWKQSNILTHSPTDVNKKNSEFLFRVFDNISSRRSVVIDLIQNVSFAEAVERRKKSTIFFDQFKVGFYGNSALEAMQWGIPVACYLRPSPLLKDCPVLNFELSVHKYADEVCRVLDSDMSQLSRDTKAWCDRYHSYSAVAKKWGEVFAMLK